jgi:hypothetical protein
MNGYIFWTETLSGERTEWLLDLKEDAVHMHTTTNKSTPPNLRRWGWDDCTEGYREPATINNRFETLGDRYNNYVACVGRANAKTFDEWLNS